MKKFISKKYNKDEPWFKWLTRELYSYEAFEDFDSGKNPENVAEDFISKNENAISEVFDNFDEEDKDTLEQFLNKLYSEGLISQEEALGKASNTKAIKF